jgi:hypothetical protein
MLIDIVRVVPFPDFTLELDESGAAAGAAVRIVPMAHDKRKKSRRVVRCTVCTLHR